MKAIIIKYWPILASFSGGFILALLIFCRPAPGYPPGPDVVVNQSHFTNIIVPVGSSPEDTNLINQLDGWLSGTFTAAQTNDNLTVTYYKAWGNIKLKMPETHNFILAGINTAGQITAGYGFALHNSFPIIPDYLILQASSDTAIKNPSIGVSFAWLLGK